MSDTRVQGALVNRTGYLGNEGKDPKAKGDLIIHLRRGIRLCYIDQTANNSDKSKLREMYEASTSYNPYLGPHRVSGSGRGKWATRHCVATSRPFGDVFWTKAAITVKKGCIWWFWRLFPAAHRRTYMERKPDNMTLVNLPKKRLDEFCRGLSCANSSLYWFRE